jgi:hypothetical protein
MDWLPSPDDPSVAISVLASGESVSKDFVLVGLLFETFHAFEHCAHLDSKITKWCIGAIKKFHFQLNVINV